MGARGPKPGSGGRPRKSSHKPRPGDGYVRETVGPKSNGKVVYSHRKAAGITGKGPNVTADHLNGKTADNRKKNLQVVSRAENARREQKRRKSK